jgi:hypothetical protein
MSSNDDYVNWNDIDLDELLGDYTDDDILSDNSVSSSDDVLAAEAADDVGTVYAKGEMYSEFLFYYNSNLAVYIRCKFVFQRGTYRLRNLLFPGSGTPFRRIRVNKTMKRPMR